MYRSNILKIDGATRTITKEIEDISLVEIYTQWKYWVLTGDNSKYFPAFEYIGDELRLINGWVIINI